MTLEQSTLSTDKLLMPNVFCYLDYRQYLKDWWSWKKQSFPGYSTTRFAKKAGLNSHNLLGLVIRDKRNLSSHTTLSFSRALDLNVKQSRFFEALVLFRQAKKSVEKSEYFNRLMELAPSEKQLPNSIKKVQDYSDYLSDWRCLVIRELVNCDNFNADSSWIVKALGGDITIVEVKKAWSTLVKLKLVQFCEDQGKWQVVEPILDFDSKVTSIVLRNFHKKMIKKAHEMVDAPVIDDRKLSSLFLSVPNDQIDNIKKEVDEFVQSLNQKYSSQISGKTNTVVGLNTQVLVLAKANNNQKIGDQ